MLHELERSLVSERIEELKQSIKLLRETSLKTEAHIKTEIPNELVLTEYYSDPHFTLVHMALMIPSYASHPKLLCEKLRITEKKLNYLLAKLTEFKLIQKESQKYKVLKQNLHLPSQSPLCTSHQTLMKLECLKKSPEIDPSQRYQIAITFSSDPKTHELIREAFLDFLKKVDPWIEKAKNEGLYQMQFELFPWL